MNEVPPIPTWLGVSNSGSWAAAPRGQLSKFAGRNESRPHTSLG